MSDTPPDSLNNPLKECPGTPNCVRTSVVFAVSAVELFDAAAGALGSLRPVEFHTVDSLHVASVHRAGFFFDDLEFLVTDHPEGSVLHVRSASRAGNWDLGVNGRRVRRFLRAVRREAVR